MIMIVKKSAVLAGVLSAVALASPALADVGHKEEVEHEPISVRLETPELDAHAGRELFVEKGCVACHSVNGVGGEDASSLDAHSMEPVMNPFDFAAKMWAMAPLMIEAQEEAFDEQILFTGEELGNIIAFLHDDAEQHKLTEDSLSDEVRAMMDHAHEDAPGEEAHKEELGHD
ncbi:c-type cytochrome [Aliiroseovarius sp.]|uniref:c-type cytochrome n=1 Tax=Aliiroseovarius sp. TaxID=1872442 RepID=UPI002628D8CC|nr:c-type cytochrome [Aliiroseovarius sp.]